MDLPNRESVFIKTEPGGDEMQYTDLDIDHTRVKTECLQYHEHSRATSELHSVCEKSESDVSQPGQLLVFNADSCVAHCLLLNYCFTGKSRN